jgi:hypothetical protein
MPESIRQTDPNSSQEQLVYVRDIQNYQTTSKTSSFGEMMVPTACETRWTKIPASFERHHDAIIAGHPDAKEETGLVHTALITIVQLVHTSPSINGNSVVWKKLADKAEVKKRVLCKHYKGKALYAGLHHLYAEIHREMNETLLTEQAKSNEEFREQRRRKRNASDSKGIQTKKATITLAYGTQGYSHRF